MTNSPSFSFHLLLPVVSCQGCCLPLPPNSLNIYQTFPVILKRGQQSSIRRWTSNKSTTILKNKAAWKVQARCTIHWACQVMCIGLWCSAQHPFDDCESNIQGKKQVAHGSQEKGFWHSRKKDIFKRKKPAWKHALMKRVTGFWSTKTQKYALFHISRPTAEKMNYF